MCSSDLLIQVVISVQFMLGPLLARISINPPGSLEEHYLNYQHGVSKKTKSLHPYAYLVIKIDLA